MNDIIYPFEGFEQYVGENTLVIGKNIFIEENPSKLSKKSMFDISDLDISQVKFISILKSKRPFGIINPEKNSKKDFIHHRGSGMNHVIFDAMSEYGINYILDLSSLKDPIIMGRVMQNIVLARKSRTRVIVGTFANSKEQLSSRKDVESLLRLLGMSSEQISCAFL